MQVKGQLCRSNGNYVGQMAIFKIKWRLKGFKSGKKAEKSITEKVLLKE